MGLQSFMSEKTPTLGSIESSDKEKRILAEKSLEFNLADPVFCELFPTIAEVLSQKKEGEKGVDSSKLYDTVVTREKSLNVL